VLEIKVIRMPTAKPRPKVRRPPEPDADSGEQGSDQRAVDLDRIFDNQEAVLRKFSGSG
jgi:hypothetical protein